MADILADIAQAKIDRDAASGRLIRLVVKARLEGVSWKQIAEPLGTTWQAAHQKYKPVVQPLVDQALARAAKEYEESHG